MRLETIRLLADNGSPLEVTLEVRENDVLVTRDGTTLQEQLSADPLGDLRAALTHYPREVRINGEPLDIAPWPGLASVTLTSPNLNGEPNRENWKLRLMLGDRTPSAVFDGRIAGVMARMRTSWDFRKKLMSHYFTPAWETDKQHHIPLSMVEVTAFVEIQADELLQLHDNPKGAAEIPEGSKLENRVLERAQAMIEHTMERPEMPARHPGRVYGKPTKGEMANEHYDDTYAVAVHGKPIIVTPWDDGGEMENSTFVTVVENLYRNDSELVPVLEWSSSMGNAAIPPADPGTPRTRGATFEVQDHPANPAWAESITMLLEMADGTVSQHSCDFWFDGAAECEAEAKVVPENVCKEEIAELLTRAYWTNQEFREWEQMRNARDSLRERMTILAEHLLGNTSRAARKELQLLLDGFQASFPLPEERITVSSRDGKLQLTLNP